MSILAYDGAPTTNDGEDQAPHSPEDSLIYVNRAVNSLLELAIDDLHGINHSSADDHVIETDDLPSHIQDAISAIMTAISIIHAETTSQGLGGRHFYSNGLPTTGVYQKSVAEPQGDNTYRTVVRDIIFDRHPADREQTCPIY